MSTQAERIEDAREAAGEEIHHAEHWQYPDPDCSLCLENWDYLGEAEEILRGKSMKMPTRDHLQACFDRIGELEDEIATTESGLLEALKEQASNSEPHSAGQAQSRHNGQSRILEEERRRELPARHAGAEAQDQF